MAGRKKRNVTEEGKLQMRKGKKGKEKAKAKNNGGKKKGNVIKEKLPK